MPAAWSIVNARSRFPGNESWGKAREGRIRLLRSPACAFAHSLSAGGQQVCARGHDPAPVMGVRAVASMQ